MWHVNEHGFVPICPVTQAMADRRAQQPWAAGGLNLTERMSERMSAMKPSALRQAQCESLICKATVHPALVGLWIAVGCQG